MIWIYSVWIGKVIYHKGIITGETLSNIRMCNKKNATSTYNLGVSGMESK